MVARWPHKQTSREGSGINRRPSGFPGVLFLFSGLVSLKELLQSLAFGERSVCVQKLCTFDPVWLAGDYRLLVCRVSIAKLQAQAKLGLGQDSKGFCAAQNELW